LRERGEAARAIVLDLLAALDPALPIGVVRNNLTEAEPTRRRNAVELLDAESWSALLRPLKPLVLALIDDSPRDTKLALAARHVSLAKRSHDDWVLALLADSSPWMRACAAHYAGAAGVVRARSQLAELERAPHPLLAQSAALALRRLDDPQGRPTMLSLIDKVVFLKGIDLFAAVPGEELAGIASITQEVSFEAGESIFRVGDLGDALFFVVEGKVRIGVESKTLSELGEREVFGEMAVLDPAPRSASAEACAPTVALRISQDDFAEVLAQRPEVASGVIRVLTRRLRVSNAG
jgi:CRP-like cAMP-binding protein